MKSRLAVGGDACAEITQSTSQAYAHLTFFVGVWPTYMAVRAPSFVRSLSALSDLSRVVQGFADMSQSISAANYGMFCWATASNAVTMTLDIATSTSSAVQQWRVDYLVVYGMPVSAL